MKRTVAPFFLALASCLDASTISWTATGAVSSATGVYATNGITADTPLSIEMKYDDQAGRDVPKDLTGIGIPVKDLDYREAINLSISITIEDQVWRGKVETAPAGSPYTLLLKLNGTPGQQESLTATVQENDGASFDLFPLESEAENNLIQLLFSSSDNSFLTDDITANAINEEVITAASGSFQSGASNKVTFTIDPASIVVLNEELISPTPILTLVRTNDNLAISWESSFDVNYQVQSSTTMEADSWTNVSSTLFGNGGSLTQNVAIAQGFDFFYRVLASPAPEL